VHKYFSEFFFWSNKRLFLSTLQTLSDAAQLMYNMPLAYSMPLARRGRPGRSIRGPRHVAPVLLVVYWLRRAIKRFMSNTGNKCRTLSMVSKRKYSSSVASLQQLLEQRHHMLASVACGRLVRVTARELMSELLEHNL
jgi:hypothetical protein